MNWSSESPLNLGGITLSYWAPGLKSAWATWISSSEVEDELEDEHESELEEELDEESN